MGLDRLKRELIEKQEQKAARVAQAQEQARKAEEQRQRDKERLKPIIRFLGEIEDFFYECVKEFSNITNLRIHWRDASPLESLAA